MNDSVIDSVSPEKLEKVSLSLKWQKLLHYKRTYYGALESEADGAGFFASSKGAHRPLEELVANLKVFIDNPQPESENVEPLICRFPARRRFFEKEFPELRPQFKSNPCEKFMAFKNSIQAVGASMVFSSYYLNNPSSAFGHTFLRFQRSSSLQKSERAELLDMGVNYAANATTQNPFLYGLFGLIGMFEGHFSKLPYYYKVREYADFESRDLWTYELDLTQAETDEIVEHLWDMGHTHFNYYFLGSNCSYHLIGLLDVIRPQLGLSDRLSFYVIPSETIKVLMQSPGLVKSVSFRPSNRKVYQQSFATLTDRENREFFKLVRSEDPSVIDSKLTIQEKVHVLDTAMDYFDFRLAREVLKESSSATQLKQKLLLARAQLGIKSEKQDYPYPKQDEPHSGHDMRTFSLGAGSSSRSYGFLDAKFRFAFHNKLDRLKGYPEFTTMEVFAAHFRGEKRFKKVALRDFSIVKIESLGVVDEYTFPLSWTMKAGLERTLEKDHCKNNKECLAGMFRLGGGSSFKLFSGINSYVLGLSEVSGAPGFEKSFLRLGLGPIVGMYRPFYDVWSVGAYYKILYFPWQSNLWAQSAGAELRLGFSKNTELYLKADHYEMEKEASLGLQHSF